MRRAAPKRAHRENVATAGFRLKKTSTPPPIYGLDPLSDSMVSLERQSSCKRKRDSTEQVDSEQPQKRRRDQYNHPPPSFWDTLSKIPFSRGALREFDRRNNREPLAAVPPVSCRWSGVLRSRLQKIKCLAKEGGPDLTGLRGFSDMPPSHDATTSELSSRGRKRSSTSGRTTSTGPYNPEFEQKLIDNGIYPDRHRLSDGRRPPKPENIEDLRSMLAQERASLSPSRFSESALEDFQDYNGGAGAESKTMFDVRPIIGGLCDKQHQSNGNIPFNHLKPFDEDLSIPQPDTYYGARPSQVYLRVREDLGEYIVPSTSKTRPVAPNFFLEAKGAGGSADVARRQAMYAGAVGARALDSLQNYGRDVSVYDGHARAITSTYHAGTGTLQMYATHTREPRHAGGEPEYHVTLLNGYSMTGSMIGFRQGAGAYRNARDWAQRERDEAIAKANKVARRRSAETTSFSTRNDHNTTSNATEQPDSDTSVDELAREYNTTVKRRRNLQPESQPISESPNQRRSKDSSGVTDTQLATLLADGHEPSGNRIRKSLTAETSLGPDEDIHSNHRQGLPRSERRQQGQR